MAEYTGDGSTNIVTVRRLKQALSGIVDVFYPVGSIYMSTVSTSPASLFGGEWEQIQDRFLLAAGSTYTAGSTGGEATHTLSVAEMPSHSHTVNNHTHSIGNIGGWTDEAGNHSHYVMSPHDNANINGFLLNSKINYGYTVGGAEQAWYVAYTTNIYTTANGSHSHNVGNNATSTGGSAPGTSPSGGGSAHNNMPPYLTVYIWKRTA